MPCALLPIRRYRYLAGRGGEAVERQIFEVSELNELVKAVLESVPEFRNVYVKGEISNYKAYSSGHHYFSLKDDKGAIRCVMFRGQAQGLRFRPENGMVVVARGRVSLFPRDGTYQLFCEEMTPYGVGDLHVAFEQLKAKLYQEGLFDLAHKKPLPAYPRAIAVITSPSGAAVHDMIRILRRRYPLAKVVLLPVLVQGNEAPPQIAAALYYANAHQVADVIITGRGGGSMEDLWAFNDERVARAIYASEIPVISAVGHEPDVTIADFVADVRAATPSHAAELAVPDQIELREKLESRRLHMARSQGSRLELLRRRLAALASNRVMADPRALLQGKRQKLEALAASRALAEPQAMIQDKRLLLGHLQKELYNAASLRLTAPRRHIATIAASLDAMSPLKVLGRGFSMVTDERGAPLRRAQDVEIGSRVTAKLSSGKLLCRVEEAVTGEA